MDYLRVFDYLSVAALAFMSYGILKQWHHVYKTKSAKDIVIQEVLIRFVVTAVLYVKIFLVGDFYLIVGQSILLFAIGVYFITLAFLKSQP